MGLLCCSVGLSVGLWDFGLEFWCLMVFLGISVLEGLGVVWCFYVFAWDFVVFRYLVAFWFLIGFCEIVRCLGLV